METKICTICKQERDLSLYSKHKLSKDGLHHDCKICASEYRRRNKERRYLYNKEYHKKNPEIIKNWRELNLEKVRKNSRESAKKNREKNREKVYQKHKDKLENDPKYRIKRRFYEFIKDSFRRGGFSKTNKNVEIIGCDYDFLREYIESQFTEGMCWDNIHIDHIKPLNSAKTEEDVILLCHYTNLQPLFVSDNISKKDKLITKQLRLL